MFDTIDVQSSAQQLQQTAETRMASASYDLVKAELSIESPVEIMTAVNESEVSSTLARTADEMHRYTLDMLA